MIGWRAAVAAGLVTIWAVPAVSQRAARGVDAPELGRPGTAAIGTTYTEVTLSPRARGDRASEPRQVGLRFWYPAISSTGTPATYAHAVTIPGGPRHDVVEQGVGVEAATPAPGRFPLVLVSHGYGGWSEHMSRLGEHLASRGYVVAAIDHRDLPFADAAGFARSFGNVLVDRTLDQQQILAVLLDRTGAKAYRALASADTARVGLIGYSMGGYGALATAGAAYDPAGTPFARLPAAARSSLPTVRPASAPRIGALVAIAPWGGQPDSRAWTGASLAAVTTPVLLISGDRDDIVDYRNGVRWLFDGLTGTDRRLLVYREARHNVAGNAVALDDTAGPQVREYLSEPVWRLDRVNGINQHFVTAFLDAKLKGEAAAARYLDVPTPVAADGGWPQGFGEMPQAVYAGDGQPDHWRGFQRRSAIGMELHRKRAGQ
jgi:alpha-beta hydrolase superfamily lysophospholipase